MPGSDVRTVARPLAAKYPLRVLFLVLGALIGALGLPFLVRGWVFTLAPESGVTLRARERNLRMGLQTDMRLWGRKVRRFGLLLVLLGSGLGAWGWRLVS